MALRELVNGAVERRLEGIRIPRQPELLPLKQDDSPDIEKSLRVITAYHRRHPSVSDHPWSPNYTDARRPATFRPYMELHVKRWF